MRSQRKKEVFTLIVVFAGVLVLSALVVYFLTGERRPTPERTTTERASPAPQAPVRDTFMDRLFASHQPSAYVGGDTWSETIGRITLRFLLAALLGAALAFRPRKRVRALKRNPYVAQTQILLAVVAAALMIVVGDNAARAFGIFAAVSLVRFRTNIRDPKEVTVLLISLAIGLACGVGRWDLALVLALFSLLVLWLLEWREPEQ